MVCSLCGGYAESDSSAKERFLHFPYFTRTEPKFIDDIAAANASLLALCAQGRQGQTRLGAMLDALALAENQREQVPDMIKLAIEDSTYPLLCGIGGSASLGGSQQDYTLLDEDGRTLTGALDSLLYERLNT